MCWADNICPRTIKTRTTEKAWNRGYSVQARWKRSGWSGWSGLAGPIIFSSRTVVCNNKQLSSKNAASRWASTVYTNLRRLCNSVLDSIAVTVKTTQRYIGDFHSDGNAHASWNSWPDRLPIASTGPVCSYHMYHQGCIQFTLGNCGILQATLFTYTWYIDCAPCIKLTFVDASSTTFEGNDCIRG